MFTEIVQSFRLVGDWKNAIEAANLYGLDGSHSKSEGEGVGGGGGGQEMFLSTHVHTDLGAYTASPPVGIKAVSSSINRPGLGVHTHTRARI
jgi:hypothetical protein